MPRLRLAEFNTLASLRPHPQAPRLLPTRGHLRLKTASLLLHQMIMEVEGQMTIEVAVVGTVVAVEIGIVRLE